MREADVVIIGAGPAGLAVAATLRGAGFEPVVLEKAGAVGSSWRNHYDRLHLHTARNGSGLPGLAMPTSYPRYPSRDEVVGYLESYAGRLGVRPVFGAEVGRAVREDGLWRVAAAAETYAAPVLVVATGLASKPSLPAWPGAASFGGAVLHSSAYRNPAAFTGQRVLVVGSGNSGGEIALDLAETGIAVGLSVRSPVNIIPRDLIGLPILTWALLFDRLPPRLADILTWPLIRLSIGSLRRLGMRPAGQGPFSDIRGKGRVPMIDIGTLAAIRQARIAVRPDIRRLHPGAVEFADGQRERYDAIVAATGFRPDLRPLLPDAHAALDERGVPLASGGPTGVPGLYFCGFHIAATGQLREIAREAERIANDVKRRRGW